MNYIFLLLLTTFAFISCDTNSNQTTEKVLKLRPFTVPLNDSISPFQAEAWKKLNPVLDSLSNIYIDSFNTEDANLRIKYQTDYKNRQDTLCLLKGLEGGYDEYMWILKNSGKPENKHFFQN